MRRVGRLDLRLPHGFSAGVGGALPETVEDSLRWWPATCPYVAPRQIRGAHGNSPDCCYSDAVGLRNFASYSFLGRGVMKNPILATGSAGDRLRRLAQTPEAIHIFEPRTTVAAVYKLCQQLICRNLFTVVDDEVARAVPPSWTPQGDLVPTRI